MTPMGQGRRPAAGNCPGCYDSQVLMLGYMNRDAADATVEKGLVTFFNRSKQRLWTKGETRQSSCVCRRLS